jgi:type I restriction-modification system DNA methylase subunit
MKMHSETATQSRLSILVGASRNESGNALRQKSQKHNAPYPPIVICRSKTSNVGWAERSDAQQTLSTDKNIGVPAVTPTYANIPGFCKTASLAEIQKHDYVLTPGRYVGAMDEIDDGEAFADKMARLTQQLKTQFEESDKLEAEIKKNLAGLGYGL